MCVLVNWSCVHVVSKVLLHGAVTEHNIDGDGWRYKETGVGMGGDGSQSVWEHVGMNIKDMGTGWDGTEKRSLCRPLLQTITFAEIISVVTHASSDNYRKYDVIYISIAALLTDETTSNLAFT